MGSGSSIELNSRRPSLTLDQPTIDFLSNLRGFMDSKDKLNAAAVEFLPEKFMNKYLSFKPSGTLSQKNITTLEQLFDKANETLPIYTEFMIKLVKDIGCNPELYPLTKEGNKLVLVKGLFF